MPSATLTLLESSGSQLIKQGAEAKVYKTLLHPAPASSSDNSYTSTIEPVLLKHRFQKSYRHPTLNSTLTKSRVAGEARALMKCLRSGVRVPGIRIVDALEGTIGIQWIEGKSIRAILGADEEDDDEATYSPSDYASAEAQLAEFGLTQSKVMCMIGIEIAKMHKVDVIHGDLTTSNMMLRTQSKSSSAAGDDGDSAVLFLIDFGLSYVSALAEDKAVDLYVLERAFASTHPDSEPLFQLVLDAYAKESGKQWAPVNKKLDEVRLRGRKRSMVG